MVEMCIRDRIRGVLRGEQYVRSHRAQCSLMKNVRKERRIRARETSDDKRKRERKGEIGGREHTSELLTSVNYSDTVYELISV